jgi:hypothetical protein
LSTPPSIGVTSKKTDQAPRNGLIVIKRKIKDCNRKAFGLKKKTLTSLKTTIKKCYFIAMKK